MRSRKVVIHTGKDGKALLGGRDNVLNICSNQVIHMNSAILIPVAFCLLYAAGMLYAGTMSKKRPVKPEKNLYLQQQAFYQPMLLGITAISLLSTYLLDKSAFLTYFSWGNPGAPAESFPFFGIKQGDSWIETGLSLGVIITAVTAVFMYLQLRKAGVNWSALRSGIFWILLWSLSNAFGEEMVFRLGLVAPLGSVLAPASIYMISAILFGVPHYAGMPNGIAGVIMAGILGYVLAKSMYETQGMVWAWSIHFLQDVVIIGSVYLMSEAEKSIIYKT